MFDVYIQSYISAQVVDPALSSEQACWEGQLSTVTVASNRDFSLNRSHCIRHIGRTTLHFPSFRLEMTFYGEHIMS